MLLVSSYLNVFFYTLRAATIITAKGNSRHVNFIIVPCIYLLLILRSTKKMLHKTLHVKYININKNTLMRVYRDVNLCTKVRILKEI